MLTYIFIFMDNALLLGIFIKLSESQITLPTFFKQYFSFSLLQTKFCKILQNSAYL